jgi:hypothetical protein
MLLDAPSPIPLRVFIAVLAVWRVTHLLAEEDGPWDAIVYVRSRLRSRFWGHLLDCFHCVSLWIAIPLTFWVGSTWTERLILWPALSGGAILLERVTERTENRTAISE